MAWGWETTLLLVIAAFDFGILVWIVVARVRANGRERRRTWVRTFMRAALASAPTEEVVRALQRDPDAFMAEYMQLVDSVELAQREAQKVQLALVRAHRFPRLIRDLQSRRAARLIRAAVTLSYAAPEQALRPLVATFERETRASVRVHLAHALTRLGQPAVIPTIIDSLAGSDEAYRDRVYGLLSRFGSELDGFFSLLEHRREPEIVGMLVRMAADRADRTGREYLLQVMRGDDHDLAVEATRLLLLGHVHTVDTDELLRSGDRLVVNLTLEAMGGLGPERALDALLRAAGDPATRKSAGVGLSRLVHDRPEIHERLEELAMQETDPERRDVLFDVMANRAEYLVERVIRDPGRGMVLEALVRSGRAGGVIAFLNRNRDPVVEELITDAVAPAVREVPVVAERFALEARREVCERLALEPRKAEQQRHERVGESTRPVFIVGIILLTVFAPFGAYAGLLLAGGSWGPGWFVGYAEQFTRFFAWYAFSLNLIYLLLLAFATVAVREQQESLAVKPLSMLFSPGMLPSISIVAPAYNEEATIVESVNSLLNLRYPDFEIIVVNDGSADATLQTLVEQFELERVDIFVHGYLDTRPVRGVYRNPRIPELIVLDKQNGGKADSLNVGINASSKEYFAAIDSDSLLERDALLRLAARFLDSDAPVVASGGNIFPVNGCVVSHGKLDEIRLPREMLGRFQTLEYIRAFMAGRTGWAGIRSLMIISGAFGLFHRRNVIDAHGYLTGTGYYTKDTVAEDMELVVRVARMLRDRGSRFAVQYGYNANCWTEVPVSHRILRNQRDRWQRGLIDTMFYHIRMLGNPRYGTMGLVGFPYFFFYELLGPWLEIQGLLFLIAGVAGGFLSAATVTLVLAATIPLGVAVSLSSVLLAEYHQRYFRPRDRLLLVLLAVLENFGYRQYAGLLRLRGYISALTKKTGWGTMARKGFTAKPVG